ncbi:cell wall / vacuolar inhibitor of fructosidase 1, CELL WALL / VACUOLAR INHIBITOR OF FRUCTOSIDASE 1 [Hibiscus trionum]|uniref:Cell wall / vacuolar inhibitor of fructosidase 1, CELL WALL / VACUOLAR INHIBITOR OF FRUCTOSIDASE 1 n=1 Tax=Hibiscus trionum TaxID=183268 RepID=A0A9W7IE25_HIBTR|nr:cell wall / vacuolar inhibitor of fructosidase 1, CELL WALL / VACUOLAR INHIBITOR OF FRUCTOSIDASE 1 [Hibiscus trionum]
MFSLNFLSVKSRENDTSLIETTCKATPFYNLCVLALESDPHSSSTNVPGLAITGANILKVNSNATLTQITSLLKEAEDRSVKKALLECVEYYNAIIEHDVRVVINTARTNVPRYGRDAMNDAANEALACERSFKNQPHAPHLPRYVHNLSVVVSSIITLLL